MARTMTRALTVAIVVTVVGATAMPAAAEVWHLATDGDDSADGRAPQTAWRSPTRAFAALRAGDTVVVGDGLHHWGGQIHVVGTAKAPVTIRALHSGKAVFVGSFNKQSLRWRRTRIDGVFRALHRHGEPLAAFDRDHRSAGTTAAPMYRGLSIGDCRYRAHCWAYDEGLREVYVRLADSTTPTAGRVVFARHSRGLVVGVRGNKRSQHLHIEGLTFRYYSDAAVWAAAASHVRLAHVWMESVGQGFVAFDSPMAEVVDSVVMGACEPTADDDAAVMFLGRSANGHAARNVIIDACDGGIRGQGAPSGAVVRDNVVFAARHPLYFKSTGYPSVADGNLLIGGRIDEWPKKKPTKGRNTLLAVNVVDNRPEKEKDRWCAARGRCARRALRAVAAKMRGATRRAVSEVIRLMARRTVPFSRQHLPKVASHRGDGPSRTVYVSPTGDDAADGLSRTGAWRTLDRAMEAVGPGDTVVLLPGVHRGELVARTSGLPCRPITVRGLIDQPAVLDGARLARYLVRLHGVRHLRFANLVLRGVNNVAQGAVLLDGAHDISFSRCFFDGRGGIGAALHARYNTENSLHVSDSVMLGNWWAIRWYHGHLTARHNVFDVGMFGAVQLFRRRSVRAVLENNAVTSAVPHKRHRGGFLVATPDAALVRCNHNAWFFQQGDHHEQIVKIGSHALSGRDGLALWQRASGNDRRSVIVADPGFVGWRFDQQRQMKAGLAHDLRAWRLRPDSPLRGAGTDGSSIGLRPPPPSQ